MINFEAYEIEQDRLLGTIEPARDFGSGPIDESIQRAFDEPHDFPPLSEALVGDDQVTLAVLSDLELATPVVTRLVSYLIDHGLTKDGIKVLVPDLSESALATWVENLKQRSLPEVQVVGHDPSNEKEHGYLAASDEGLPIVLSRHLLDADMVIPVKTALRNAPEFELCPVFANAETKARFQGNVKDDHEKEFSPNQFSNRAIEQLGVFFEVHIVPGPGQQPAAVIAGEPKSASRHAHQQVAGNWRFEIDEPVDLLIVEPKLETEKVTLQELLQCATKLAPCLVDDGTIVIEANLNVSDDEAANESNAQATEPSEGESEEHREAEPVEDHWTGQEDEDSAGIMTSLSDAEQAQFASIIERIHIVVVGEGYGDEIEDHGIGVAASAAQVRRLASRYDRCLMVRDGLRCDLRVRK